MYPLIGLCYSRVGISDMEWSKSMDELDEKLLLFGGAIREAGSVKGKKSKQTRHF